MSVQYIVYKDWLVWIEAAVAAQTFDLLVVTTQGSPMSA